MPVAAPAVICANCVELRRHADRRRSLGADAGAQARAITSQGGARQSLRAATRRRRRSTSSCPALALGDVPTSRDRAKARWRVCCAQAGASCIRRASGGRAVRMVAHVRTAGPRCRSPGIGIRARIIGRRVRLPALPSRRWEEPGLAECGRTDPVACSSSARSKRRANWAEDVLVPTAHVRQRAGRRPRGTLARTIRVKGHRVDGVDVAPDKGDAVVDLDDSFVFPGLINAHDHLELNSQPRLKWRERYDNAREWIADFQPRFADRSGAGGHAARHARRSRVGRRLEEPAVGRDHRLPSQPAAPHPAAPFPGARRQPVRLQPLAADRRRGGDRVISRDAARTGRGSSMPARGAIRKRSGRSTRSHRWDA